MKILMNISMFFIPAIFSFIVYIGSTYRRGGQRKGQIFLLYFFSINVCTFLVSCARGIGTFHFETMTVSYRFKYILLGLFFGLLFWSVSQLPKFESYRAEQRSHELDFLKLLFALCIFIFHSRGSGGENTNIILPGQMGAVSVYFFFMVSGMLMANSIVKKEEISTEYGKLALHFVIRKIKIVVWDVYAALFVFMSIYIFTIAPEQITSTLVKTIPALLFAIRAGIDITYNAPTWYLSAMFLCMLPLSYLLYKKRDFTLYILAPLLALFTLGWSCQTNDYCFLLQEEMYGVFLGDIYTAVCGLCFGICAYNMYIRLYRASLNENMRMILTFAEVFLYAVFFGTWFLIRDNRALMSVVLILPIVVATTFSGKSYIVKLFQFEWMKWFAPLSLKIYLNHWIGRILVQKYFEGNSYGVCVLMMAVFMLCSCLLSTVTIKIGKYIWEKRLKIVITN